MQQQAAQYQRAVAELEQKLVRATVVRVGGHGLTSVGGGSNRRLGLAAVTANASR
jgi:hypothetical protein